MRRYYIIGGTGNASANVIETGLSDISAIADEFVYLWTGKPTDGQARVLDWLISHEIEFSIMHEDGKVHPKVEAAAQRVVKVDNLVQDACDGYGHFSVLVLWDEEVSTGEPTALVYELVTYANTLGMESLDLCNGLVPLLVSNQESNDLPEAPRKPQEAPKVASPSPTQDVAPTIFKSFWVLTEVHGEKATTVVGDKETVLEFLNKSAYC